MKQVNRRFILAADSHLPSELAHSRREKSALYSGPPPPCLPSLPPAVGGQWPHCPRLGVKGLHEEDQNPPCLTSHLWPKWQVKACMRSGCFPATTAHAEASPRLGCQAVTSHPAPPRTRPLSPHCYP